MDILDRLIDHDAWTMRNLLSRCGELSVEQMHERFDVGHEGLYDTIMHVIGNIEVWTDLMLERPVRGNRVAPTNIEEMRVRYDAAMEEFGRLARLVRDEGRLDDFYLDVLDEPPKRKSFGGTIAHVLVHDAMHRSEMLHMLQRLGVKDLIEGDVLSWEQASK
jgi:uncharacterized damage-inducible protein DinB